MAIRGQQKGKVRNMLGTKIYKEYIENPDGGLGFWDYDEELYFKCSCWCNDTQIATIEDKGEYYEVVAIPAPSLDELKTAKLAELKNTRDTLEVEPITYNGNNFDYDEKARDRINAAIIALDMQTQLTGTEASLSWTTADNTEATVTANDLRGIIANVALRSNELHIKYRELKDLVESAETKEDLDKIMWEEIDGN